MDLAQGSGYPSDMATKAGREAWLTMVNLWFLDGHAHDRILDVALELGLPPGMLKALTFLAAPGGLATPDGLDDENGIRMGDLADQWGCDASYVTTITDGLEERGLAERRPLPRDRRVKTVALTATGTATLARAMELLSEPPAFLDALSAAEQRTLRDLLRKIASVDRSGQSVGTATPRRRVAPALAYFFTYSLTVWMTPSVPTSASMSAPSAPTSAPYTSTNECTGGNAPVINAVSTRFST